MNIERIMDYTKAFLGGTSLLIKGIDGVLKYSATESPVSLLKTGAILFPLSILIGIATDKIFDDIGWEPSLTRSLTTYLFTSISSTALASAAAVGFGFTASLSSGFSASLIAIEILLGLGIIGISIVNIYSDINQPAPIIA